MKSLTPHPDYPNFYEMSHPLVLNKLTLMRDKNTDHKLFRELLHEVTLLLGYEATYQLKTTLKEIETPLEKMKAPVSDGPSPVILPILRAGLGMTDALLSLMPAAKVGHIGLRRNEETHRPEPYYFKIPEDSAKRAVFLCDPMLATGGSVVMAINTLKQYEIKDITLICVLVAPEGLKTVQNAHPDVPIFAACLDKKLDKNCYIRPGLGDAGDRIFGTE